MPEEFDFINLCSDCGEYCGISVSVVVDEGQCLCPKCFKKYERTHTQIEKGTPVGEV